MSHGTWGVLIHITGPISLIHMKDPGSLNWCHLLLPRTLLVLRENIHNRSIYSKLFYWPWVLKWSVMLVVDGGQVGGSASFAENHFLKRSTKCILPWPPLSSKDPLSTVKNWALKPLFCPCTARACLFSPESFLLTNLNPKAFTLHSSVK